MSEFTSFSVGTYAIVPEAITFFLFITVGLFLDELLLSVCESAFRAIGAWSFDLIGSAELCFVFILWLVWVIAIAGGCSGVGVIGGCFEVLFDEFIHVISIF
jgi:hypothetical protein